MDFPYDSVQVLQVSPNTATIKTLFGSVTLQYKLTLQHMDKHLKPNLPHSKYKSFKAELFFCFPMDPFQDFSYQKHSCLYQTPAPGCGEPAALHNLVFSCAGRREITKMYMTTGLLQN